MWTYLLHIGLIEHFPLEKKGNKLLSLQKMRFCTNQDSPHREKNVSQKCSSQKTDGSCVLHLFDPAHHMLEASWFPQVTQLLEEIRAHYGRYSLASGGLSWDHRKCRATAPVSKRLFRQKQMMTRLKQKYFILAQNVNMKHSDICKSILFRNYVFQFEMKTNMEIPEFPMGQKFYFSMNSRSYLYWEVISLLQSHCFLRLCLNLSRRQSGTKHLSQSWMANWLPQCTWRSHNFLIPCSSVPSWRIFFNT